jgi:hypothetical protein
MALKGDRYEAITLIDFFMDSTAERGGVVCLETAGSGAALDQAEAQVDYMANPSGYAPVGVLMNDVVNIDLTRQQYNAHKDEMQVQGKVCVLVEGWVVTNMITPGVTPTRGQKAYVHESGYISTSTSLDDSGEANMAIGRFLSTKDEDGYCKVYVKMPGM